MNTHPDVEQKALLVDYYMQSIRSIDGLRGMGRTTEQEITTVLFALIATLQAEADRRVEEANKSGVAFGYSQAMTAMREYLQTLTK